MTNEVIDSHSEPQQMLKPLGEDDRDLHSGRARLLHVNPLINVRMS